MKELPYGISDYEKLVESNCYYVDKTKYIEQLEIPANSYVMFLRPRKFGKTLFTSMIENYYDVNKKDKFEELFKGTYIGKIQSRIRFWEDRNVINVILFRIFNNKRCNSKYTKINNT